MKVKRLFPVFLRYFSVFQSSMHHFVDNIRYGLRLLSNSAIFIIFSCLIRLLFMAKSYCVQFIIFLVHLTKHHSAWVGNIYEKKMILFYLKLIFAKMSYLILRKLEWVLCPLIRYELVLKWRTWKCACISTNSGKLKTLCPRFVFAKYSEKISAKKIQKKIA